jgi:hypothetical protein
MWFKIKFSWQRVVFVKYSEFDRYTPYGLVGRYQRFGLTLQSRMVIIYTSRLIISSSVFCI